MMRSPTILPADLQARRARFEFDAATYEDLRWLRARMTPAGYVCDCRCECHRARALPSTGSPAGSCGMAIDPDTLDCSRSCRSAHILASDCKLDEHRPGAHV